MTLTARSPLVVTAEQRRADVARMRREGATLDQIAAAHGVSRRTVQRDLDAALSDLQDEQRTEIDRWRAELLDDLSALRERAWIELDNEPTPQAVAALVSALTRAVERTAALVGADAPQRIAVGTDRGDEPKSLADMYSKLPVRSIERARSELNAQLDEALARRREYDEQQRERIAALGNSATGTDA